ncbi:hypothetical protein Vafri_296 [Volvox africanus]|nr:hypothetical protein Vafri_296 [Volvox africanus]
MIAGRVAGAGAPTAPPDLALPEPGTVQAAATRAAAATVVAPASGDGGRGGSTMPYDAVAASEREAEQALLRSEIGSLVTTDPRVSLSDLESKLEIIRPEDLQIIKFLGSGGYGEVYLCRWHSCDVAAKCLNPSLLMPDTAGGGSTMGSDVVTELLREAAMLGGLRHPNIVWVYGIVLPSGVREVKAKRERLDAVGDIDVVRMTAALAAGMPVVPGVVRPPALVTEYLGAGSLRAALTRGSDFLRSDMVRVKLALDAARGMEYLHLKRIVHFDLKTANLLVGFREKSPTCKVSDFGLSKQRQQTYVTGVSSLRGTLPWTAPEIIRTPKAVKDKADVYSFGVVLWELWTFREPFEGINYHALLHQISVAKEPVRPAMPGSADWDGPEPEEPAPGWVGLMCRCWDEDPDTRPPFTQVVSELETMLAALKSKRRATSA